jgi:cyanophycinase-like exopeptidase
MKKILLLSLLFFGMYQLHAQSFSLYQIGNINDLQSSASGGICLMGGATESDEAARWFLDQTQGGDVVVLRTSGSDGYNSYFYSGLGANINSVRTIVFNSPQASSDTLVLYHIQNAEGIWFAGGDQWDYISYWRNTAVDSIIRHKIINDNLVVGGTSAGMAILGRAYFSAQNGTVQSSQVLSNPYHPNVQLDSSRFIDIPLLKHTITDTHYDNPDRKGRHIGFMARLFEDFGWTDVKGIACDEYTAVCIDSSGIARVFGDYPNYDDNAYFLRSNCEINPSGPEICLPNQNLSWSRNGEALFVYQVKGTINGNNTFDLNDWQSGSGGQWYHWYVQSGQLFESVTQAPSCNPSTALNEYNSPLTLSPSPFKDLLKIRGLKTAPESIVLRNANGQSVIVIDQIAELNQDINTSQLPSGIYTVQLIYKNTQSNYKILKH